MDTNKMLEKLIAAANTYKVSYEAVQFPLYYSMATDFSFGSGEKQVFFNGFSRDGLTYLLYRLGSYIDRKEARQLFIQSRRQFVQAVNLAREYQCGENIREAKRERLIAAFVERDGSKKLWGLMTNYQAVSHLSVLEKIKDSKLVSQMTYNQFTPKEMLLFFKQRYIGKGAVEYGLAVRNGETGHATLSYVLAVRSADYVFCFPSTDKRRHLSRVNEVDLENAFEAAATIEMQNKLEVTPVGRLKLDLTKYSDALSYELFMHEERSVADTLGVLLRTRQTKGLKTASEKLMDAILTAVDKLED